MMKATQTAPNAHYRQMLKDRRFVIQRSASGGMYFYPPRVAAPGTGADDLEWVEPSGLGAVYAITIISRKAERGGDYNIAIVELDEGPRIMTRIVDAQESDLRIGLRVKAKVVEADFGPLAANQEPVVVFVPLLEGRQGDE